MFWQAIYVSQFMISSTCSNFNEMFAATLYFVIYDFVIFIHVQILTKCLYKWFLFRNLWSCVHVEIVFDVWWIISFVWFDHICSMMFSSTCSIRNCLYWRRFLYNFIRFTVFSYWFQDVFRIEMLDQKLFRTSDVFFYKIWWHVKQLLIFNFVLLSMRAWLYQK